ncbi:MAG: sodium:proton antiporter [Anaerolineales bacterium]|nr:sodium:proton antiporter [Anaerolineales bacterium]
MDWLTAIGIALLFGIGVFQILRRNMIRSVIGMLILFNAINLFLLSAGAYQGDAPAYTTAVGQTSDALPQALVLTAIVIGLGGIAFVLALIQVISARYRTSDQDQVSELRY